MSDIDLEYKQIMRGKESQRFVEQNREGLSGVVHLEASYPPKKSDTMSPGSAPKIPTAEEEALQTPGGDAASTALQAVGKVGKQAMQAVSPALDAAGKAIGLELPRGGVEKATSFVAGLPDTGMSDTEAGVATAGAGLPLLGTLRKAGKLYETVKTLESTYPDAVARRVQRLKDEKSISTDPEHRFNLTEAIAQNQEQATTKQYPPVDITNERITEVQAELRGIAGKIDMQLEAQVQHALGGEGKKPPPAPKFPKDTDSETISKVGGLLDELKTLRIERVLATQKLTETPLPFDAKKLSKLAEESASDLYEKGGSTFSLTKGNLYSQPSYAVAVMPEYRAVVPGHASVKDIENFVKSLDGKVDLNNEVFSVGTWYNKAKGQTEMTVSLTLDTLDDALAVAKAGKQQSIYSLGSGQEIFTGVKDGQSGKVNTQAALTLALAMTGGAFGYAYGEDDEKVMTALKAAGLAALAPMALPLAKSIMRGKVSKVPSDKAGKLTKEEVASPLADIAKQYREARDRYQRGHISHAQSREAGAAKLAAGDLSDEYLLTRNPGATYNEAEMSAMKEILAQEGQKLQALSTAYQLNPSNKQTEEAFLRQFATYAKFDPLDVGLEAEAGRSLSYINDVENEINDFTRRMSGVIGKVRATQSPLRMAQMVSSVPSFSQLNDFARRATAPGMLDMIGESWVNGLLSQPITHVTNSMSNALTILSSVPERAIAQGFGSLSGGPGGVVAGETSALARGYLNSVQGSWALAAKAFRTEESAFGATKMETRTKAISQHNFDQMLERSGADPLIGGWTKMIDYLGVAARIPGRLLLAEDELFKAIAFGGEASAQAWRHATLEVASSGVTGKTLKNGINTRYNQIMADPAQLSAFQHDAEQFAHYVTFTKDLGETGQQLQALARHPMGRFIAPFLRTPINIAKYAGERTPFALMSKAVWADIQKGGADRDLALAKMATGSSAMVTFSTLAAAGVVTGFGPADKETRAMWQTDGRKPYSTNVSGLKRLATGGDPSPQTGDQWITYSRLDPVGMLIGLSADVTDIFQHTDDPEVADHLGARLTLVASHVIASKTYVKGVAEWMFAAADPEHYGGKLEESLARTLVTTVPVIGPAAKLAQRASDPLVRETNGVIEAIKSTLPGYSTTLPPKRNYWGEVALKEGISLGGVGLENALSPLYRSTAVKDDVVKRLVESQVTLTIPKDTIGKVKLDPAAYDYLRQRFGEVEIGGKNVHQAYEELLKKFPDNTTDTQSALHVLLKSREDLYKNLAREEMFKKFPAYREATGRTTAQEKAKSLHLPPPKRGVSEITVE